MTTKARKHAEEAVWGQEETGGSQHLHTAQWQLTCLVLKNDTWKEVHIAGMITSRCSLLGVEILHLLLKL